MGIEESMSKVFVVDDQQRPLDPIHPGYARWLLTQGKAVVFRRYPFAIRLKKAWPEMPIAPLRLKLDPGSKTTGLALVNDASGEVVWAAELTHRGQQISKRITNRRAIRRSRRQRKTRYRPARFQNRSRALGWLPPSLKSRVINVMTWVARLRRLCPILALSQELVRFDTQALQDPAIAGIEYQQGELAGFEIREYLLCKWRHACAYCSARGLPLEVEHVVPRSRGGSNRISNLTLACHACNQAKGDQTAEEFGFPTIQAQAKAPLKDVAVVNSARWALYASLTATGLPVETGTGGLTKWNRIRRALPKTHWLDAANVGASTPPTLQVAGIIPLLITARGWQCRQMCRMNRYGFPCTRAKLQRRVQGFRTGDLVRAVVPNGKKAGTHVGRVTVRTSGFFSIATARETVQEIAAKYCQTLHLCDGYAYQMGGCV